MPTDQNADAIRRLSRRVDEQDAASADRIDALAARIVARLDQIEARSDRRAEIADGTSAREFGEVRRDLGELRDVGAKLGQRVDKLEQGSLQAAARGAAEGAGIAAKATAIEIARNTARGFWATTQGKIVGACAVVAGVGAGIDNLPKIARILEAAWAFILRNPPP